MSLTAQERRVRMSKAITERQASTTGSADLEAQIEKLTSENQALKEAAAKAESDPRLDKLQVDNTELSETVGHLGSTIESMESTIESQTGSIAALEATIKSLEAS